MGQTLTLLYGVICCAVFFLTFLYAIGFVADAVVPLTVDRGRSAGWAEALVVDLLLLGLFAIQHSGMARRGFKHWLTRVLPWSVERSTYVLLSSAVLIVMFWQWRPIPGVVWDVQAVWGQGLLYALAAFGWLLVLTGTFVISHFDLFGLRQVWLAARGRTYSSPAFKDNFYYRMIRHPLMLGFIIAFWATPRMTLGHLLFAVASTGYILIAVKYLEERDLLAMHGETYREYQKRVPMIFPWPRPAATASRHRVAKPAADRVRHT